MLPLDPLLRATAPAGPHLPTATLRQYAAGTLSAAAAHRVEAHTLACPRCADILDGLLQTPPATTDQALHQLQQRLRLRVQQAETARPSRHRASHRWLVPQLAAAATLLFGLLAGGWYTWQQRHAAPASQPMAGTQPEPAPATVPAPGAPAAPAASATASVPSVPAAGATASARPASRAGTPALAARLAHPNRPLTAQSGRLAQADVTRRPLAAPAAPPATEPAAPDSLPVVTQAITLARPAGRSAGAAGSALEPAAADNPAAAGDPGDAAAKRKAAPAEVSRARMLSLMPAAPAVAPTPASGYPAWREKIRRAATEFRPADGQPALSGSVQLRLLIGADGKIQETRVLHGLRADYDEEAQRLACDGPAWIPGIGGGRRAPQTVEVSVSF